MFQQNCQLQQWREQDSRIESKLSHLLENIVRTPVGSDTIGKITMRNMLCMMEFEKAIYKLLSCNNGNVDGVCMLWDIFSADYFADDAWQCKFSPY